MSDTPKTPSEESEDAENLEWAQIVHNDCGLPIEFCICPDNPIRIVENPPGDQEGHKP